MDPKTEAIRCDGGSLGKSTTDGVTAGAVNGAANGAANGVEPGDTPGAGDDVEPDFPNPRDGFRVREHDSAIGDEISLWLEITLDGVVQTELSQMVWCSDKCDVVARGERQRYQAFWEAVARFMNCGGTPDEARETLAGLDAMLVPEFRMPGSFILLATMQEVEPVRHIFFDPNVPEPGAAIDWIEDIDLVERTMREVIDEAEELEDVPEYVPEYDDSQGLRTIAGPGSEGENTS